MVSSPSNLYEVPFGSDAFNAGRFADACPAIHYFYALKKDS
jgi:hypothetical protein